MKTALFLLLLGGGIVLAGWRIWQAYEKKADASQPAVARGAAARVMAVSTTEARVAPVHQEIEITGSLKPKQLVDVTPKIAGRVQRLAVQVGDAVRQGQLIAVLEDAEVEQQVRRAQAAREVARATEQQRKAELSNAKADADRAKQLFDQGLIARQDYDAKLTAYRVFQAQVALVAAQVEQASAELRELTIQRGQMTITSPINGTVAQRFIDIGALVSPTTPIARIVNISTMVTAANVPERDVSRLRVGGRAVVTVDAAGSQEFVGTIARIAPVLDPATRTVLVEVEIPNPSGALKAEMFARVKLGLGGSRDAIVIPRDALVYRGQQAGVYVVEADRPVFRAIEAGTAHGSDIEVIANLSPGTVVVNRGAAMLREGDRIRITEDAQVSRSGS